MSIELLEQEGLAKVNPDKGVDLSKALEKRIEEKKLYDQDITGELAGDSKLFKHDWLTKAAGELPAKMKFYRFNINNTTLFNYTIKDEMDETARKSGGVYISPEEYIYEAIVKPSLNAGLPAGGSAQAGGVPAPQYHNLDKKAVETEALRMIRNSPEMEKQLLNTK
jgi:hypothetical protein